METICEAKDCELGRSTRSSTGQDAVEIKHTHDLVLRGGAPPAPQMHEAVWEETGVPPYWLRA